MKKLAGALLAALLLFCQSVFADQPTTVLTEIKDGKQIHMERPVIDGANDEALQHAANNVLRSVADDVADKVGKKGKVTYEVTLNRPSLVSVLLKGSNNKRSYFRAVNIDLTTGREFSLDEFFFGGEEREKLCSFSAEKSGKNCWARMLRTYSLQKAELLLQRKKAQHTTVSFPIRSCCPCPVSVI